MARVEIDPLDGMWVPTARWGHYLYCSGDVRGPSGRLYLCQNWIFRNRLGDPAWGDAGIRCWVCQQNWRTSYLFWGWFFQDR